MDLKNVAGELTVDFIVDLGHEVRPSVVKQSNVAADLHSV